MQNGKWHTVRNDLHYPASFFEGQTAVASQATRVYEHREHLASSRIARLTSRRRRRRLTDAGSNTNDMTGETTRGRFDVVLVGTTERLEGWWQHRRVSRWRGAVDPAAGSDSTVHARSFGEARREEE